MSSSRRRLNCLSVQSAFRRRTSLTSGIKNGILVMNMVGHPKHVAKGLIQGVDIICAQAGEAGGHTGDAPSTILIPACVDAVKHKSPLTGDPVYVVTAGGVYDGRGLAANFMYGAQGVWIGTRFVASLEAGAPPKHKEILFRSDFGDTVRTLVYTGRSVRVIRTPWVADWEENRQDEIKELTSKGIVPWTQFLEQHPERSLEARPWLMGSVSAVIKDVLPAKEIIDNMVRDAARQLQNGAAVLTSKARL